MKAILSFDVKSSDELYIPHGSDESMLKSVHVLTLLVLYIPHGSDERIEKAINASWDEILYIPHGSDESLAPQVEQNHS